MPQFRKNDEFEIEITDMDNDGGGIGHAGGMTFFVKDAVVGDVILAGVTKMKKNYGYARIVRIISPSGSRVKPLCPIASRCGGCSLQHLDYKAQLKYKQKKVTDALIRIGGIKQDSYAFCDIIGMEEPYRYRNKGQFPVGSDSKGRIICGFYAKHSHDIVDTESCLLQHPITDRLMKAVREYMDECGVGAYREGDLPETAGRGEDSCRIAGKGERIMRHILTRVGFTTHEVMVCAVIAANELPSPDRFTGLLREAVEAYNAETGSDYVLNSVSFNINRENTNVILGSKVVTIAGLPYITDYIDDMQYRISPLSFFQVNPVQTEKLYYTALEFASPGERDTVWDLYCGTGTISLFMSKYARKVIGIEIVPQAVEDARENARMNGITNAEFICGAAESVMPRMAAKNTETGENIVIVDPPRKGCDAKLLECIINMAPRKIVYISCDPATLARDIRILGEGGYEPEQIQPVEMFPQTSHVETVCLLSRE